MEMLLSAVVGEAARRTISAVIDKFSKPATAPSPEASLQRKLLRARVVVEEAEARQIEDERMLQQLDALRDEMYRGHYTLDTFKYQAQARDEVSHYSFALSIFNPVKRVLFCDDSRPSVKDLQHVLSNLETVMDNFSDFVMVLKSCPPLYRQPYSMHLFVNNCMFGRQMEMERVIDFLLQMEPPGTENLDVLPIIGPGRVGKSTLIEYVYDNERVRNHFSQIVLFDENDLKNGKVTTLKDGGTVKRQNHGLDKDRLLIIIELVGDVEEGEWKRLYSASKKYIASGSKIIITSRSDKIARFGTTQALKVKFLTREMYWYFFKLLTFGSMDPEEHPKLASIAMEMAVDLNGSFICANIMSGLLRANFNAQFWHMALACAREYKHKNLFLFGAQPIDLWQKNKPIFVRSITKPTEYCVLYNHGQTGFVQQEIPKINIQQILSGSVKPRGKVEVLAWKSHIPPHYNYMFSCEIQQPQYIVAKKRHYKKNRSSHNII